VNQYFKDNDSYKGFYIKESGKVISLYNDQGVRLMSNNGFERHENSLFEQVAKGRVLIGGLGLGYAIMSLQDREDIESIDVLEINQDLIDWMPNKLPFNKKVNVIKADIFTFESNQKYDSIYMDIWFGYTKNRKELMEEYSFIRSKYSKMLDDASRLVLWNEHQVLENYKMYLIDEELNK
jgi:spermidine synthase